MMMLLLVALIPSAAADACADARATAHLLLDLQMTSERMWAALPSVRISPCDATSQVRVEEYVLAAYSDYSIRDVELRCVDYVPVRKWVVRALRMQARLDHVPVRQYERCLYAATDEATLGAPCSGERTYEFLQRIDGWCGRL